MLQAKDVRANYADVHGPAINSAGPEVSSRLINLGLPSTRILAMHLVLGPWTSPRGERSAGSPSGREA